MKSKSETTTLDIQPNIPAPPLKPEPVPRRIEAPLAFTNTTMNTDRQLAAAQERVAALELEQALDGFNPVLEARIGPSHPGTGGQSPSNENAIKKLEEAEANATARAASAAMKPEDRDAVVRYLAAGQAPDSAAYIRQTVR
jgi:hypothetical protein